MKQAMWAVIFSGVLFGNIPAQGRACKPSRHAKLPVVKDSTYHKARKKLIAAEWQPLRTKSNEAATDPDITSGNGPLFWRKG